MSFLIMAETPKLIGEFLTELVESQELFERYLSNPEETMAEAGLNGEQRETLLSNDLKRIRNAIRVEYESANVLLFPVMQNLVAPPLVDSTEED
jgi:hypothetical protein